LDGSASIRCSPILQLTHVSEGSFPQILVQIGDELPAQREVNIHIKII